MTDPYVSRLFVYPVKALDRVVVKQIAILKSGALQHDREFAILDAAGNFVNGKRNDRVHAIRSHFDLDTRCITVSVQGSGQAATFHIDQQHDLLAAWLGGYFGFPVQIQQNLDLGFPDDTVSPGPTIISTATLEAIASWYPHLEVEEVRRRFRSNIEIGGVPAFWEDQLFTTADQTVDFQIGGVRLSGVNPCQRCVVITRDSQTGIPDANFQKTFIAKRQETLPNWVERSRFNHFYRLAINTRLSTAEAGHRMAIGDPVRLYD